MIKEEIEGALASWCWNNEFVSLDEHKIWSKFFIHSIKNLLF